MGGFCGWLGDDVGSEVGNEVGITFDGNCVGSFAAGETVGLGSVAVGPNVGSAVVGPDVGCGPPAYISATARDMADPPRMPKNEYKKISMLILPSSDCACAMVSAKA